MSEKESERRREIRIPVEIWVEEITDEGDLYFQRAGNISVGGLYFEKTIPHPKGTIVNVKFSLPGSTVIILVRAEIVSASRDLDGLGMGLKFLDLKPADRKSVEEFIAEATK